MPARHKAPIGEAFHSDSTRAKIKTAWLIKRLQDHIAGTLDLSMSQVRAIGILLRKTVPDLTSVEITADVNYHYVAELPVTLELETWKQQYSPPLLTDGNKVQ